MTVLVLGGTADAIAISNALNGSIIYSLAGVTKSPNTPKNATVVSGGFGGVDGLIKFIKDNKVRCVVDCTHPYAKKMKNNAIKSCEATDVPLVGYQRTLWEKSTDKDWISCVDIDTIVQAVSDIDGDIFIALGAKDIERFSSVSGRIIARMVLEKKVSKKIIPIVDKGPFTKVGEEALFDTYDFKALVCKNSGTDNGFYKVEIAQQKGIPVFMLECPNVVIKNSFINADEMINYINAL